jgi:hypothetical protein
MSVVAAVVGSDAIILVEGVQNPDGRVTIVKDETFDLEEGDRRAAYAVMHKRVCDRLCNGVQKVVLKASSGGQFPAKAVVLHAAELRGVFLSAIPSKIEVVQKQIKVLSRAGSRKVNDYVKDDKYFGEHFSGNLRKGSREAAFLLLAVQK